MNDHELDAALRILTAVDAAPALADRVLRAIDAPAPIARSVSWVAAAAAILLAVIASGTWYAAHPVLLPRLPASLRLAQTRPLELRPQDGTARETASLIDSTLKTVPARRRTGRPRETDLPWPSRIAALEQSEPLAITPLDHSRIGSSRLGIQPLSISQLEIASLER